MRRTICTEIPSETSLFTPMQLQPRALTWLWMSGWANWLRTHLISFPKLVRLHQTSFVIIGYSVEMLAPFGFYDSDAVTVELDVWASGRGRFVESDVEYCGAGRPVARGHWVLMPVRIQEAQSLAAQPMRLSDDLMACLTPDEVVDAKPQNLVPPRLQRIMAQGEPIGEHRHAFTIHRHHCEVADQWCFVEIPSLAAASREEMAIALADRDERLVTGVSGPLRRMDVKLTRPLFAFDQGQVQTTAYHMAEEASVCFVHRIVSELGAGQEHGVIIEEMGLN
jgi:hypothetical protein